MTYISPGCSPNGNSYKCVLLTIMPLTSYEHVSLWCSRVAPRPGVMGHPETTDTANMENVAHQGTASTEFESLRKRLLRLDGPSRNAFALVCAERLVRAPPPTLSSSSQWHWPWAGQSRWGRKAIWLPTRSILNSVPTSTATPLRQRPTPLGQ